MLCRATQDNWVTAESSDKMWSKKQQLELDIKQLTGSKLGKECSKDVHCHAVYLTYLHSTSCNMLGWMINRLESRLPQEISAASVMQMIPL